MKSMPAPLEPTDPELLALARDGNHAAYGRLVSRHQTLVVSLAYSICGDFAGSQDVAQEAFVTAWRQLATLEDATKFKAWVCGIARNLGHNLIRRQTRRVDQPITSPENAPEAVADAPSPREQAVTREEAAIVWRALEQLPESYREPLVLFYREHQSVERVAAALDLSEDTVKQRLSRGRGMLRDQVESLVERSLGFTTPGLAFTTAVLGALPLAALPIAAATMAGTAMKGGAATKAAGTLPWLVILASPLLAIPVINIVASVFFGRQLMRSCRSPEERKLILRLWWIEGIASNLVLLAIVALGGWQFHGLRFDPTTFALICLGLLGFMVVVPLLLYFENRRALLDYVRNIQLPADASPWRKKLILGPRRALIYRSRLALFGLPLVDIRFGHSTGQPLVRGTAVGWIALGDIAHGVVFALGGFAVGGIAVGGIAIGALSTGYLALGLVAFGGVAAGGLAKGVLVAAGYVALGTVAVGWEAASGILSVAKHIASGSIAFAESTAYATTHGWEETNPIVSTFKVTGIPAVVLPALLNAVFALVATTAFARHRYTRARDTPISSGQPTRPGVNPVFLGLLFLVVVGCAMLGKVAVGQTARRLDAERELVNQAKVRFELARESARAGKPADALAGFLWCLDDDTRRGREHGIDERSAIYTGIEQLSRIYPPAKAALRERRDRAEAAVLAGHAGLEGNRDVWEVMVLNLYLGETPRSRALYDQLPQSHGLRPALDRHLHLNP